MGTRRIMSDGAALRRVTPNGCLEIPFSFSLPDLTETSFMDATLLSVLRRGSEGPFPRLDLFVGSTHEQKETKEKKNRQDTGRSTFVSFVPFFFLLAAYCPCGTSSVLRSCSTTSSWL